MGSMNEEEILKWAKDIQEYRLDRIEIGSHEIDNINDLLSLYNKEREKNKELLKEREDYTEEYIHNNPWLYKQLNELYIFRAEVDRNYISKDKIKQKIKELKENEDCTYCNNCCNKYLACTILQELLEE